MKRLLSAILLIPFLAQSGSLAQKPSPPAPPPSGGGGGVSPFPPGILDRHETDWSRLERKMDEERMATPELPTKAVTASELEKTLADNRNSGDARLAAILSGLTLSERAAGTRFSRWNGAAAGAQTRQALTALADGSAFLTLPGEDVPDTPTPSLAEQKRIIAEVGNYLSKTLPALPNFRATRHTTYFEDRPPRELPLGTDPTSADPFRNRPLHVVGSSKIPVAYVNGHEVVERKSEFEDPALGTPRFGTAGEFGPILYGVMMDAAQNRIVWAGWEPGPDGPLAVFRFDTPKEKSHFSLKPPGVAGSANQFVAYGGDIAVNPANGTIMRLSVIARPGPDDVTAAADIEVEYGLVEIGQRFYTCPVHAIAMSKVRYQGNRAARQDQAVPLQTQINDVVFEQYHVFRGDPHMVQETAAP